MKKVEKHSDDTPRELRSGPSEPRPNPDPFHQAPVRVPENE
jgi:hypothetical protein